MVRMILLLVLAFLISCGGGDGGNGQPPEPKPPPISEPYLTWDENTEPDLAGYVVYWGAEPSVYDHELDVEMDRIVYLSTLDLYLITYFVVTAYDTSYNESDNSKEISWENK